MEQFFVGLLFGVIFSAAFYFVGLRRRNEIHTERERARELLGEIVLVVLLVVLLHLSWDWLSSIWAHRHYWFHDYVRRPIHWFQFIMGAATGVLLRLWAVRLATAYPLTERERPRALWPAPAAEEKPVDFLTRERGWMFALVGLLLLAVLLPQLESLIRAMTSFKVAGVEVAFKDQKESNRSQLRPFDREKTIATNLKPLTYFQVSDRLGSDDETYKRLKQPAHEKANAEYLAFYDLALGPYLACMSELVDQGYEVETIRASTRELVAHWQHIAIGKIADTEISNELVTLVATANKIVKKTHCAKKKWNRKGQTGKTVGLKVKESPEFYRMLAFMLQFLDNRLAAIQLLESVQAKFGDHLNQHYALAVLYFDEDPTLEKSLEHHEIALRVAEDSLATVTKEIERLAVTCPRPGAPAGGADVSQREGDEKRRLCYDNKRFQVPVRNLQNGVAYVLGHVGGSGRLARAMQLAKKSVRATRPAGNSYPANRDTYLSNLDTLAFVVMASEAASSTPDVEGMACAEAAFRYLAEESRKDLVETLRNAGKEGFRTKYLEARYSHEAVTVHVNTAAVLRSSLERSGLGSGHCPRGQLDKLMEGTY